MCVATKQRDPSTEHMFLSCQQLAASQNLSPTRTLNPIYNPHKAINFSNKGIPSFLTKP